MKKRFVLTAALLAALVACKSGGPTIQESAPPAASNTSSPLVEHAYPDLGFSLSTPSAWQENRRTVEDGRTGVLRFDPTSGTADKPRRAVDVIVEVIQLDDVRRGVVELFSKRFPKYREIRVVDGLTAGGHRAFRHEFLTEGLRYEQWWIERAGGTFRVTLWASIESFPRAGTENAQIIATFRETA